VLYPLSYGASGPDPSGPGPSVSGAGPSCRIDRVACRGQVDMSTLRVGWVHQMSDTGLQLALDKMTAAGVGEAAQAVFAHYYRELADGATGMIGEDAIAPATDVPLLAEQQVDDEQARAALDATVMIRLNGGLGTSMGISSAKSLLPVRPGKTFLDLIVDQVRDTRRRLGVRLPLVLMNSFRTQEETLAALADAPDLPVGGLPLDFVQNSEPKLRTDDLTPVEWPADPSLEWCPPGHGDIYPALYGSGLLDQLVDAGFRYALVANSDNLGARPDARLAGWFAGTGAPFAMEVCARTKADRKGGHLAVRRSDGRLMLREVAQTPAENMTHFTDETRHRWFSTNTLWWDLVQLRDMLRERSGVLGLPLIRNKKTVDPTDPTSPEVFQIETAMGAALEVFEGATAIGVGRDRFLPVKTTNDLLLLRSDAYEVGGDGAINLVAEQPCLVDLAKPHYGRLDDFEQRFASGAPSLLHARALTVQGDWTFGADVTVTGSVTLADEGTPSKVPDGAILAGE
jgi:UTP--glucose-1-phosphate uridylyltransferase